ncbi:MAG: Valyl-tRNA synthetase [Candidatus Woesebacteria bacterium GW2011_GWD1_41_12]|uniref:Valine--tRNA ligase n=1 Tax=Candidatus Woesebacteria bacterium GW2011_GWD1_41_12 TaxID=1618593 RepID=A0A0G0UQN5_9BACT|nr:MAG: Valyl-tRNA synthetase [Candidatus Woesebacteria bacterium GW2011_GWD1_41_12]
MESQYDHKKYEAKIYDKWEESGAFTPQIDKSKTPFTIVMPPPNANDPLHIGHARFVAIEDVLTRYHRMKGDSTLWLPGSDHAGIETQYVFEKKLKDKGKSRFDFDRDTLYGMIWEYVQENTGVMESQLKKLGASCDWSRFKFTLDPEIIKVVYNTFKKLYDDGLIYRGERIVNYCPRCGTAYSQLEVDYVERDDKFYYIDYGSITIATTRPETIFADVAVAVNPKDNKYKNLVGLTAKIPLINREVPVIADNLVDISTGTGALKITPAHDPVDFEIGQKHKLPSVSVIDESGRMVGTPEKYVGMKAGAAREEVVKDLIEAGKLIKTEVIHHTVGTCYRDHGAIEPTISKQWFMKVKPLVKKSLLAMKNNDVRFVTKKFEKIAKNWYKNLKDWNISRQIVWGMRIPAYRCDKCLEWTITDGLTPEKCDSCGHAKLIQDSDTFDTWFSSGQWPFATLKSSNPGDFEYFYPTSVMETAYDILPFWVIRMIMLGVYITGKVPFQEVLIHGLVRDKEGQKISKSKGNVINPIEMADKYGADALRMGILWGALVENDVSLSEENINAQRKFCNKVWNASRFVSQFVGEVKFNELFDKRLHEIIKATTKHLDKYKLNQAAELLYSEFWHWYCDECIENSKKGEIGAKQLKEGLLVFLKLLHPFMPFVTEQIWNEIGEEELLITSPWPKD